MNNYLISYITMLRWSAHLTVYYKFNLQQLRQGFDSLTQWLECMFISRDIVSSIPKCDDFF